MNPSSINIPKQSQQRRLSSSSDPRCLSLLYKPNKPDIDLIKPFRKNSVNILTPISLTEVSSNKRRNSSIPAFHLPCSSTSQSQGQGGQSARKVQLKITDEGDSFEIVKSDGDKKNIIRRSSEIVCRNKELIKLKCLSEMEISHGKGEDEQVKRRSKSFDYSSRVNNTTNWFNKARHQPFNHSFNLNIHQRGGDFVVRDTVDKIPPPAPSPILISPTTSGSTSGGGGNNYAQSRSPNNQDQKLPWEKNQNYFLDAGLLGQAIENHLKLDKRRATFSNINETSNVLLQQPTTVQMQARTRSLSAHCVITTAVPIIITSPTTSETGEHVDNPLLQSENSTFTRSEYIDVGNTIYEEEDEDGQGNSSKNNEQNNKNKKQFSFICNALRRFFIRVFHFVLRG